MSTKKQRNKNRNTARLLKMRVEHYGFLCQNCGKKTINGHFAPPSFKDVGYYICKKIANNANKCR